ncbi:MAG: nucleotidyltransferase domain-containing protein [Sulfuritalea sp.]|nr:nucleotidyltransferase domain-containing protein [Sulfuritalea sp.]
MPYGLPDPVVEKLRGVFKQYPQVSRVSLYGSRAKGNFQPGSDIDLCVEGNVLTLADLFEIENRIDDLLLPWKVDLSLRHGIHNPELLEHIDRVGVKLFEADSSRALSANS